MADLEPFATSSDLAVRLGVTYTVEQAARVDELLADACDELRTIIGQSLTRLTSTVTLYTDQRGRVILPAVPVVSVDTVEFDGEDIAVEDWQLKDDVLLVPCTIGRDDPVEITFTHGWDPVPRELVKFACSMASAVYEGSRQTGALGLVTGVGRRQEGIDDYLVIVDSPTGDDTAATTMSLPQPIIDRLRRSYGGRAGAWWVEAA